jgi:hypothetical protein
MQHTAFSLLPPRQPKHPGADRTHVQCICAFSCVSVCVCVCMRVCECECVHRLGTSGHRAMEAKLELIRSYRLVVALPPTDRRESSKARRNRAYPTRVDTSSRIFLDQPIRPTSNLLMGTGVWQRGCLLMWAFDGSRLRRCKRSRKRLGFTHKEPPPKGQEFQPEWARHPPTVFKGTAVHCDVETWSATEAKFKSGWADVEEPALQNKRECGERNSSTLKLVAAALARFFLLRRLKQRPCTWS